MTRFGEVSIVLGAILLFWILGKKLFKIYKIGGE